MSKAILKYHSYGFHTSGVIIVLKQIRSKKFYLSALKPLFYLVRVSLNLNMLANAKSA